MPDILWVPSPLGRILLAADAQGLIGAWFEGARYFPKQLENARRSPENAILAQAERWIACYFAGQRPDFMPPLHMQGTGFQVAVWQELMTVPYGHTISYGELAQRLCVRRGMARMAAQAVGGAVGRNAVHLIIPCHRVIGADGGLVGYGAGLERKKYLLTLENAQNSGHFSLDNALKV